MSFECTQTILLERLTFFPCLQSFSFIIAIIGFCTRLKDFLVLLTYLLFCSKSSVNWLFVIVNVCLICLMVVWLWNCDCFIYNSSSITFWTSQFSSSSRNNWTSIWTGNSNGSWTDEQSSHFSTVKEMGVKATFFFMHCNPVQGSTGFCREIPVMKTGSLHWEKGSL